MKIFLLLTLTFFTFSSQSATRYGTITADTQMKGSERDIEVTRQLRQAIMADDQLSTDAKNIKIITLEKNITLKGHVASRAEKVKIENLARARAGKKRVYNRLTY